MSRFPLALLLAGIAGLAAAHGESRDGGAQDQKTQKAGQDKAPGAPEADAKDEQGRVCLAFDPGSHTRPISALGFTTDQSKLVTVGWDYSIQVWNTATGERLDILHLPPFGRDNGFDQYRWSHAAVSADGAIVVVGGSSKVFGDDKDGTRTRLVVVDVAKRTVRRVVVNIGLTSRITCLAVSPDGDRVALGTGGTTKAVYVLDGVKDRLRRPPEDPACQAPRLVTKALAKDADNVALSRAGDRLAVSELNGTVSAWDVSGTAPAKWKKTGDAAETTRTDAVAWSPDGTHFARAWGGGVGGDLRGIELRGADGKQLKGWTYKELTPGFGEQAVAATMRYLAPDRLFVSAHGGAGDAAGFGALGVVLDPTTGKTVRRFSDTSDKLMYTPFGAASEAGDLAATTTPGGTDVAVYRLSDGKVVARCGNRAAVPTFVGWASDPKAPAVAWGDAVKVNLHKSSTSDLKYAFDLSKVEPAPAFRPAAFDLRRMRVGEWSLEFRPGIPGFRDVQLKQTGKPDAEPVKAAGFSMTLVPNGKDKPLVAFGTHDNANQMGGLAYLRTVNGKSLAEWFPVATKYRDMVSSPDGRYVLVSTGTPRLSIYRTDGSQFPLLNLVQLGGEWVVWTPEGYYAASPGGEKMIGWSAHNGPNELATFHPAVRFAKQFRRPDVIRLAIEKGSVKDALAALNTVVPEVERILPPTAKLELVETRGAKVTVRASASSGVRDKPVTSMRVMMDGVALPDKQGVWAGAAGKPAEAVFTFDVTTPGPHVLQLLARSDDGPAVSAPLTVEMPRSVGPQPTLHRVCVGINEYAVEKKLAAAAKDARDMFDALAGECVGPDNIFGAAEGEVLLDKDATRTRILQAVRDRARATRPGHLFVLYFATHGYQQGDDYYLLTPDADHAKALKDVAVSGADIQQALEKVQCPVLLVLDSCYSGGASGTFLLTRKLTDDATGVWVFAAASSDQEAGSSTENGYFTAGLLKGLRAGEGALFNPTSRQVWTHHLYAAAFDAAYNASKGKQTPCLTPPLGGSSLLLRQVPKK